MPENLSYTGRKTLWKNLGLLTACPVNLPFPFLKTLFSVPKKYKSEKAGNDKSGKPEKQSNDFTEFTGCEKENCGKPCQEANTERFFTK